jgi:hypothetical protein
VNVQVFVEGGGDQKRTRIACRKAFATFFEKALGSDTSMPRISACGSRDKAYRDFCRKTEQERETFSVLLVDSEGPVAGGISAWNHLGWQRPANAMDHQAHLMVQCMESWFLADRQTLATYYGAEFRDAALPGHPNPEDSPKRDVMGGLSRATVATQKGEYHKTRHAFEILERIDPALVRARCPHVDALLSTLAARLSVS